MTSVYPARPLSPPPGSSPEPLGGASGVGVGPAVLEPPVTITAADAALLHPAGAARREPDRDAPSAPATLPTVLVVEDDTKLAAVITRALRRAGYRTSSVTTGDAALRAMRETVPSAAVVDIMIPHPDGIEVCRKVRRDGWTGPVIAVSGRAAPDDRRRALDAGADLFLAKPFRLADLIAALVHLQADPPDAAGEADGDGGSR